MSTAGVPEGWTYEAPEPSVGLFVRGWIHDDCEYGEVTEKVIDNKRDDATGDVTITVELSCSQCGDTTTVTDHDYDPIWESE